MYRIQLPHIAWLYMLSTIVAISLAIRSWNLRPVRGAALFSGLNISVAVWSLFYLLGFYAYDLEMKLIWLRFEYLGIICAVCFWLLFVLSYTNYNDFFKARFLVPFFFIPFITFVQILFIEDHTLFYSSFEMVRFNTYHIISKEYGFGFVIWTVFSYLNILAGTTLLILSIMRMPEKFKAQTVLISLAVAIIILPNFFYVIGFNLIEPHDPTPISFALSGLIFIYLFTKYKFLDVTPVAYKMIFNNVKGGILIIDNRDTVIEMNLSAEKMLDYSSKDAIGKNVLEVFSELADSLTVEEHEHYAELKIGKGKYIYEIKVSTLFDGGNKPAGKVILFYDITNLKNTVDELETYASTVAHDLKNPLGAIRGFSELLLDGTLPQEDRDESVHAIYDSAEKLLTIVDALLLLSSTRRQGKVELTPVDLNKIVKNVLSRMEYTIREQNAKIILPEITLPKVIGYAPWIEEVCINYLSNAIKYGGEPPVVEFIYSIEDDMVKLGVYDNGTGLTKKEQEKLFEEYSRLQQHEATKTGHGLGLAIVKRIIKKLGGEVGVISDTKTGCTFYFTLPLAK